VFSAFTGGVFAGQASALFAWSYIAYFFSTPSGSFHYTDENLRRVMVWAFTTPAMALLVGILKRRADLALAQEALRESEARKGAILESALDSIVTIDHAGRVIDFNPTAEKTFGYARAQVVGREMCELLIPPSLRERHRRGMAHYLATGEGPVLGKRLEMTGMRADGTEFPVELAITRIQLDGPPMFTAYLRDLTEHKRLEAIRRRSLELEVQYRQLQEANRLKGEFLANMSHELRTPLNAIIGFAELMHDGKVGPVSGQHKEFLGDILSSSRHLLQLINDVLDLAKVEAGKVEFRPEAVDLARVVTEVQDILRPLIAKKRIHVQTEIDPTLTEVVVDSGKLKQILYNYLSNALKFTPEEGRVMIRVGSEGLETFRLEVEDTGIGIRPEDQGRLFVEFQQLDASTTKKYPGTGLGLALTKRIVEAQGGQVGVRSMPGQGSTFFAVLPRVARAEKGVSDLLTRAGAPDRS
jgi:PAS domain S-box-containing protein